MGEILRKCTSEDFLHDFSSVLPSFFQREHFALGHTPGNVIGGTTNCSFHTSLCVYVCVFSIVSLKGMRVHFIHVTCKYIDESMVTLCMCVVFILNIFILLYVCFVTNRVHCLNHSGVY